MRAQVKGKTYHLGWGRPVALVVKGERTSPIPALLTRCAALGATVDDIRRSVAADLADLFHERAK